MDDLDMLGNMNIPASPEGPGERGASGLPALGTVHEAQRAADAAAQRLVDGQSVLEIAGQVLREAESRATEDLSGWQRAAAVESLAQVEREHERAAADVSRLAGEDAAAREHLAGALEAERASGAEQPGASSGTGQEPELFYGSTEEFLHEQLLPLYNRIVDGKNGKWCRKWYLHPEAVSRVEALWRAWEHLRLDAATGASVWWRDHADPHMGVLLSTKGPFHACSSTTHYTPDHIVCEYAPEGWFPDERTTRIQ